MTGLTVPAPSFPFLACVASVSVQLQQRREGKHGAEGRPQAIYVTVFPIAINSSV